MSQKFQNCCLAIITVATVVIAVMQVYGVVTTPTPEELVQRMLIQAESQSAITEVPARIVSCQDETGKKIPCYDAYGEIP